MALPRSERRLAELVLEERQDPLWRGESDVGRRGRELLPHRVGLVPLVLVLVQLLEVRQRVAVPRIEPQHFGERLDRAIDEAAAAVVEPQAEQHVGVLQLAQVRALQQRLVLLDRAADLALLAIQVAENQVDLERIAGALRRLRQLVDRLIDLVGDQEVQAEHVVRRLARAPPVDPAPSWSL